MTNMTGPSEEQGFGKPVTHLRQAGGKRRKHGEPRVFSSNIVGQRIVNAMTGSSYDYVVGSKDEKRFFKVAARQPFRKHIDLLGDEIIDADGYQMNTLFYDTPDQYEKHKRVTLSDDVKTDWYERHPNVERVIAEDGDETIS